MSSRSALCRSIAFTSRAARLSALALALTACPEQLDLVALGHREAACDAAACGMTCTDAAGCDAGCMDAAACSGGCADSSSCDAGCADAAACSGRDAGCIDADCRPDSGCSDADACQSSGMCSARLCTVTQSRPRLCQSVGVPLAVGDSCASATSNPSFRFALCSAAGLNTHAPLSVEGDVSVDSNEVTFGAEAEISGVLHYAGSAPDTAMLHAARVERSEPGCKLAAFDVAATVRAFTTANDNSSASASLDKLRNFSGDTSISLPCGRYYAAALEGNGKLTIHASGNVALFVGGNVQLEKGFVIDAPSPARVTLVVSGTMNVNGGLILGDEAADQHLLVIGTGTQLHLDAGASVIGGTLYAPDVALVTNTPLRVNGAVYVQRAQLDGMLVVHASNAATSAAVSCDGP